MTPDKEIAVGAGRTLFKQGDKESELYFVTAGQIDLLVKDEASGKEVLIATIGEKSVLGTMSFLEGEVRNATAITKTDVKLVKISQVIRDKIFKTVPNWFGMLIKDLTATVRELNKKYLKKIEEFEAASKKIVALENQIKRSESEIAQLKTTIAEMTSGKAK